MQERTQTLDVWAYPDASWGQLDLSGFEVEALDGSIGTIDEATREAGASYFVIDTGPWIFGQKVMLPAGVIERLDPTDRKVFVRVTKEQIKSAPRFDEGRYREAAYREELGGYYRRG